MASNIHGGRVPAVIKGHQHFSYGGTTLPESVTVEQYYDLTPFKKSNVRFNDELIPKPTNINIGEKQIKVSIPREHPYQSHISRCSMFPTYRCPDDPDTGVWAASKLPINPLLPASAPQVTLLSKTKGTPYRHELLDIPMETRRDAATWPGPTGFQIHTKPVKGETQVFYPKAPKTLCPNRTLRDWKTTLDERTANVLRNLGKAQWLTSYQLHYTGTGPTNPIKLDDFNEKTISLITGEMNPYTTQLRARSYPVFLPPRPLEGRRARILQNQRHLESTYPPHSPSFPPEPPATHLVSTQTLDTTSIQDNTQRIAHNASLEAEVFKTNKVYESSQTCQVARHNAVFNSTAYVCEVCWEINCVCKPSESDGTKPQTSINKPSETGNETENTKLEPVPAQHTFQPALHEMERSQRDSFNNRTQNYVVGKNPFELNPLASPSAEETDRLMGLEQTVKESEERMKWGSCTVPSIRPCSSSGTFGQRVRRGTRDLRSDLLELQDSFSRTEAHRRFHESLQDATVDLRDNHHIGRKHFFYGFNSYYFHN